GSDEKESMEEVDEQIAGVHSKPQQAQANDTSHLQSILKAISNGTVVTIDYTTRYQDNNTSRNIEPIGIFYLEGHWHLIAYCRLRKDYRDFRTDRIHDLKLTDERFTTVHPTLNAYLQQVRKEKDLFSVVIRVNKQALPYLEDQKYFSGFVAQKEVGEKVEMSFLTGSLEGFARWYMMFGDT